MGEMAYCAANNAQRSRHEHQTLSRRSFRDEKAKQKESVCVWTHGKKPTHEEDDEKGLRENTHNQDPGIPAIPNFAQHHYIRNRPKLERNGKRQGKNEQEGDWSSSSRMFQTQSEHGVGQARTITTSTNQL